MTNVTIRVSFAWWFVPYLKALAFVCSMFDAEPREGHVEAVVARGVRFS